VRADHVPVLVPLYHLLHLVFAMGRGKGMAHVLEQQPRCIRDLVAAAAVFYFVSRESIRNPRIGKRATPLSKPIPYTFSCSDY
jgi:hypothetical protein